MNSSLTDLLRRRLIAAGAAITLLNIAFVAAYYGSDLEALRLEMVDRQVQAIVDGVEVHDGKAAVGLSESTRRLYERYPEAYGFRVIKSDQIVAEANPKLIPDRELVSATSSAHVYWHAGADELGQALVGTRRIRVSGKDLEIAFVAASDPAWLTLLVFIDEQVRHVLVPLLPFALLLTFVNIATVRTSLAPLKQAAEATLRESSTFEPVPTPTTKLPSEVAILVDATNVALSRLSDALQTEKAFTADAAHALRTPLAVLSTRVANLPDGPTKAVLTRDLDDMRKLVQQLLAAAHADQLKVSETSRCDLIRVAQEVVAAMAPIAIAGNRSLALQGPDGPVPVVGDHDALAHALRNLIDNAMKFSPPGSEVTVMVHSEPSIEVHDRGPGIPESDKPHVCKRFWHGNNQGTGLGLAIVSRIAEAHAAALSISDREGGGTTVRLRLRQSSSRLS